MGGICNQWRLLQHSPRTARRLQKTIRQITSRTSFLDPANVARIRRTSWLICPSGSLLTGLSSLISDFPKNILVPTHPKSHLELWPSHPTRGAYHDRHETRGGMRWTRQRFAREGVAGRVERLVSDYQASGREMLLRTAKSCGPDAPTLASSSRS